MSRRASVSHSSDASMKLSPFHVKPGEPHPEEWTLLEVHKMEKRETFDSWYADLQANILSCAKQINTLLEKHPHPNAQLTPRDIMQSHYLIDTETDRVMNEVHSRNTGRIDPISLKLSREEEIRLYKGI